MAENNEVTKPDYYKTIVVRHMDPDRGAEKFDQLCNEYEALHTVKDRTAGFAYANTAFVYIMTFCCDGNDGGNY